MKFRFLISGIAATSFLAGPAFARQAPANPTDPIYACAAIPEDAARLACFDDAVAALRTKEEAGIVRTIDVEQIETIEKESFGFSMPSLPGIFSRASSGEKKAEREQIDEISVAIKSARIQGVTGKAIVTLENGQTWEQTDTAKVPASTLKKAKNARVRKAALGSYMMIIDEGRSFRVKRTN